MAQQQYQISQMSQVAGRPFSPTQPSPSPGPPQVFSLPPTKRQKLSPDPRSQPPSPYVQSPYNMSPTTNASPPTNTASTHFNHISLPPNIYNTPYGNGHTTPTPTINLSTSPSNSVLNHATALPNNRPSQPVNGLTTSSLNSSLHPNNQPQGNTALHGAGIMGPPSKPAERDSANDDQMDVLTNAGVDIRAEEMYAMSFHTGSFKSQPNFSQPGTVVTGHAFTQFGPGDATSLYGAGPATQIAHPVDRFSQDELQRKAVDQAWADAALNLARSRQHELDRPHVNVLRVWSRMDRIARENGLALNTDPGKMPAFKVAAEFQGEVEVQTLVGQQVAMTVTTGPFVPSDVAITDQLALMSLATNQRIRILLEEAVAIARGRRTGTQGVVPAEWVDVSRPSGVSSGTVVVDGPPRDGWESAVSPRTNPLKRSLSSTNRLPTPVSNGSKTPTVTITYNNDLVKALRNTAKLDRNLEESRLLKRQNRSLADGTSRPNSVAPGTPGPVAPEPIGKPLTKKEREKQDKGKQSVADSHAQANATTNKFLFGGRSKNKYSWMTGGASGSSGANTPVRIKTQGLPGTPGGPSGGEHDKLVLTADGINKMGAHREDRKEPGPLVEMRDLVMVLENDGRDVKTLQDIYAWLENPKSKRL